MSETKQVSPVALREARERTIQALCAHFAEDRLDVADFESRLDRAHQATALAELDELVADLPALAAERTPAPAPAPARKPAPPVERPDQGTVIAILGENARRGAWTPARHSFAFCLMGGIVLDFREAALPPGPTEISIFCLMGGVEIIVPPDLALQVSGVPILGGIVSPARSAPADADQPHLRINAFALMGGVEVSVRLPGESERDAKRRIREEKKRKKLPPSTA